MEIVYVTVTLLASLANGYAAVLNFAGAESVKLVADRVRISPKWMFPLGTLLLAGGVGLLVGLVVPPVGVAAAISLAIYFVSAITAHIRVRDSGFGGAVFFFILALGALIASLARLEA